MIGFVWDLLMEARWMSDYKEIQSEAVKAPAMLDKKQKACPQCGSIVYRRIRRKLWMQLLIGSRYCECLECFHRYLVR